MLVDDGVEEFSLTRAHALYTENACRVGRNLQLSLLFAVEDNIHGM